MAVEVESPTIRQQADSKGWEEFWKTDDHYKAGSAINEFEFRNTKIMTALCGDMWDFPEIFRSTEDTDIWGFS